MLKYISCRK